MKSTNDYSENLSTLNPYHLAFIFNSPMQNLDNLKMALRKLDESTLTRVLEIACLHSGGIKHSNSLSSMILFLNNKCTQLLRTLPESAIVTLFITTITNSFIASYNYKHEDIRIDTSLETKKLLFQKMREENVPEEELESAYVNGMKLFDKMEKDKESRLAEIYDIYNKFCDVVVSQVQESDYTFY